MSRKVSLVRCDGDLQESLGNGFSLLGGLRIPKLPILIKPNLCAESDPTGIATTRIPFIKAVIDLILNENEAAVIKIVESNSSGKQIKNAFKNLGYTQMERTYQENGYKVTLINLSKAPLTTIILDEVSMKRLKLPTILTQPNFFISLANAKTHSLTQITGVLKNQFGCLPEKEKYLFHKVIDTVILEINRVVKPDLCIIDALFGLEGVLTGRKRKIGIILCGRDPVAVDVILARVMGFTPSKIKHITLAAKHGLGSLNPEVVGGELDSVIVKFRKETNVFSTLGKYIPINMLPLAHRIYSIFK